MKTDKELADELDAKKRMQNHGYRQKTCPHCRGVGMNLQHGNHLCYHCEGKGYTWEHPIARAFREARESITPESVKMARDSVDKAMKRAAVWNRKMDRQLERLKP